MLNIPDAVSLRCLSVDLDMSANSVATQPLLRLRERERADDIGELNQRGGRIMEGGRESDKEGERREIRDGKTERD